MDRLSPHRRSWNMSRIRGRDTRPERTVRSVLHRLGFRFRLHRRDLPGVPDIVLTRHRTVIFVHGCFWHRHTGCRLAYTPKSNAEFWLNKLTSNVKRDAVNVRKLRTLGWTVMTIWECQVANEQSLEARLNKALPKESTRER